MDPKDPQPEQTPTVSPTPTPPVPPTPAGAPPAGNMKEPAKVETGGYSKRPVWQWVALYVAVAVVVYALIYFLFIKGDGSGY